MVNFVSYQKWRLPKKPPLQATRSCGKWWSSSLNSLIPFGMIFGGATGVVLGMFFEPIYQVFSIALGAGIGL
ncbi:hypothetical protein [Virgibacillus oceani]|uniref:Uncharacterized protein n=1 Tax=Virgibacillus oceani TaxID=1479511 RepID=A0A917HHS5_9BACI|nr:hypothetical protein [Virgibacillus oceani]GGG78520.1 hypothetical protein GCM10011398_24740 [Virgibacillus oceani]